MKFIFLLFVVSLFAPVLHRPIFLLLPAGQRALCLRVPDTEIYSYILSHLMSLVLCLTGDSCVLCADTVCDIVWPPVAACRSCIALV